MDRFQTEVVVKTKTHAAIAVSVFVMMAASLGAGVGFGFMLLEEPTKITTSTRITPTTTTTDTPTYNADNVFVTTTDTQSSATAMFATDRLLVQFADGIADSTKTSIINNEVLKPQQVMTNKTTGEIIEADSEEFQDVVANADLLGGYVIKEVVPGFKTKSKVFLNIDEASDVGKNLARLEVVTLERSDADINQLARNIQARAEVEFAIPNIKVRGSTVPNDPLYSSTGTFGQAFADMWGLKLQNPEDAWDAIYDSINTGDVNQDGKVDSQDILTLVNYVFKSGTAPAPGTGDVNGDGKVDSQDILNLVNYVFKSGPPPLMLAFNAESVSDVVVAISDTGVDYNHIDLDGNMWKNDDEIPGNGIDDDGNGYIDDYLGYDFTTCRESDASGNCIASKSPDADPIDKNGHGTFLAGEIAAEINNSQGIASVCPHCKIMPVQGFDETDWAYLDEALATVEYAADNGADIINMSWGFDLSAYPTYEQLVQNAMIYAYNKGVTLVAATGNDDWVVHSPAKFPEVIAVGAFDHNSVRTCFSNFGSEVDFSAPGGDCHLDGMWAWPYTQVNIVSTKSTIHRQFAPFALGQGGMYFRMFGTSMASPYVAGAAALVKAVHPEYTPTQVKDVLVQSATDLQHTAPSACSFGTQVQCEAEPTCFWNTACFSWDSTYGAGKDDFTGYGMLDLEKVVTTPAR